jgi:hypothetical protein
MTLTAFHAAIATLAPTIAASDQSDGGRNADDHACVLLCPDSKVGERADHDLNDWKKRGSDCFFGFAELDGEVLELALSRVCSCRCSATKSRCERLHDFIN